MERMNGQGPRSRHGYWHVAKGLLRGVAIAAGIAALYGVPAAVAQGYPPTGTVLTDKDAYLLLPAELISGPVAEQSSLSPEGENLVVLRRNMRITATSFPSATQPHPPMPPMEQELIFWHAASRKPVSLWESVRPLTHVTLSPWMPGTASLFAVVQDISLPDPQQPGRAPVHEWKLLLLGHGIEHAQIVALPTGQCDDMYVNVSPLQPLAVVQIDPSGPNQLPVFYLIHQNGRVGARVDLPAGVHGSITWDAAGSPIFLVSQRDGAVNRRMYYSVDAHTGQTRLLPSLPPRQEFRAPVTPILPFHLVGRSQDVAQADSKQAINPVWLESLVKSEKPRALLAADGTGANLLPDAKGALFNSQNALWFTPIVKIEKATYLAMRNAAERATAISNAKQLGLGLLMYAQDYDEVLPSPEGLQEKLIPYIKNDSLFQGFAYTYGGGGLADIPAPAETVLGHVDGPGGHAVIYADGHVKWQNN